MSASATSVSSAILLLAQAAKEASVAIASSSAEERNRALEAIAQGFERGSRQILTANAEDLQQAQAAAQHGEMSHAIVARLKLSPEKLSSIIAGVRAVAKLPDPIGR